MAKTQLSKTHKSIATSEAEESEKPTRSKRNPLTKEQRMEGKRSSKAWRKRKLLKRGINEIHNELKELPESELKLIFAETEEGKENVKKAIVIGLTALKTAKLKLSGAYIISSILLKKGRLFCWDNVPGKDNGLIVKFLKKQFKINWAKEAKIEKIDDGMTLIVSKGENSISFELDNTKTILKLKIGDNKTHEFIAKTENGKLNIYEENWIPPFGFDVETGENYRYFRLLRNGNMQLNDVKMDNFKLKPIFDIENINKKGEKIKGYKGTYLEGVDIDYNNDDILIQILKVLLDCIPPKDLKELIDEIEKSDATDRVNDATCGSQTELEEKSVCKDKTKCPQAQKGDSCSALNLNRALKKFNSKYVGDTEKT